MSQPRRTHMVQRSSLQEAKHRDYLVKQGRASKLCDYKSGAEAAAQAAGLP